MNTRVLLLLLVMISPVAAAESPPDLAVVYTGRTFAALDPCDCPGRYDGGIARRATAIRRLRENAEHPVLVVTAGNFSAGGPQDENAVGGVVDGHRNRTYLKALGAMRYNALTPGAAEWQLGREALRPLLKGDGPCPVTVCNVQDEHGDVLNKDVVLESSDGATLAAVVGVAPAGAPGGFSTTAPAAALRRKVAAFGHARVLVVLAALDEPEAVALCRAVPGIDLMVCGGRATSDRPGRFVGDTLLVFASHGGRELGVAEARVDDDGEIHWTNRRVRLSSEVPDDTAMAELVTAHRRFAQSQAAVTPQVRVEVFLRPDIRSPEIEDALADLQDAAPEHVAVTTRLLLDADAGGELVARGGAEGLAEARRQAAVLKFHPQKIRAWRRYRALHPDADWTAAARECGILPARIRGAVAVGEADTVLRRHLERRRRRGVQKRPALYINGRLYTGKLQRKPLLSTICDVLQQAVQPLPASCRALLGKAQAHNGSNATAIGATEATGIHSQHDGELAPRPFRLTVVHDPHALFDNTAANIESLRQVLPGVEVVRVDYRSAEGQALIARANLKRLPAYLADARIRATANFAFLAQGIRRLPAPPNGRDDGLHEFLPDRVGAHQWFGRPRQPGRLDLFVAPATATGGEAIRVLLETLETIEPTPDVRLRFAVFNQADAPGAPLTAPGGRAGVEEALRIIGIRREHPQALRDYLMARSSDPESTWWDAAAEAAGLQPAQVRAAALDPLSRKELQADAALREAVQASGRAVALGENQEVIALRGRSQLEQLMEKLSKRLQKSRTGRAEGARGGHSSVH